MPVTGFRRGIDAATTAIPAVSRAEVHPARVATPNDTVAGPPNWDDSISAYRLAAPEAGLLSTFTSSPLPANQEPNT